MDLYLSSLSIPIMEEFMKRCPNINLNLLFSRAVMPSGMENIFKRYGPIMNKVALDCGSHSYNNSNMEITEQQLFAQFLWYVNANKNTFDLVFSYDPDFGPDGFENNLQYFIKSTKLGINVVPVIHNMNSPLEIRFYIDAGCDTIAIGKQKNKTNPEVLFPFVFMLRENNIRTHLFGVSDFELISRCPISSCDSKSWLDDAKTGVVRYWNELKDELNKTDVIYFPNKLGGHRQGTVRYDIYDNIDGFKNFIGSVGLTINDLLGRYGVINRALLSILYYKKIEEVVTHIHLNNSFIV